MKCCSLEVKSSIDKGNVACIKSTYAFNCYAISRVHSLSNFTSITAEPMAAVQLDYLPLRVSAVCYVNSFQHECCLLYLFHELYFNGWRENTLHELVLGAYLTISRNALPANFLNSLAYSTNDSSTVERGSTTSLATLALFLSVLSMSVGIPIAMLPKHQ